MENKNIENEIDDSLGIYLREINEYPLISPQEQEYLARKALEGDIVSRHRLVNSNLRFVVNIARKYKNRGIPLEDLINEGNTGLMKAIDKFDVNKGCHFITYAVWWIRQSITKAINERGKTIRLPVNKLETLSKIGKIKSEYNKGDEMNLTEIARDLDMPLDEVIKLINISKDVISLETPINDQENSIPLKEFISDEKYKSPEQEVISESLRKDISIALKTLSLKEAQILEYRFGLNGKFPSSLKHIGELFNLTKERIRQIENKALSRLRKNLQVESLRDYLID